MTDSKFRAAVVDLSNDSTAVTQYDTILRGVHVQGTTSAQACPIKNGSGGTTIFSIPASSVAGIWYECGDTRMDKGIFVDPDNSATGTITVVYKPLSTQEP